MNDNNAQSILRQLIELHGSDLRGDLLDVRLGQDDQQVWLETVTQSGAERLSLDFITSGDAVAFSPAVSLRENVASFLRQADIESLCMTTDLIKPDACRLHFQHDA